MLEIKQFWLDYIFSCKNSLNREQAKIEIDWLYKLAGCDQPIVIYVDSPLGCQYAVAYLKEFAKLYPHIFKKSQVRSQVGSQVWSQVESQVIPFENFASYGSVSDYGWISFMDFFKEIGVVNNKDYDKFRRILLSGVYDMIQLNGFCIVSNMPSKILTDSQGRLHNKTGPAIEFRDGYCQYFVEGKAVFVPQPGDKYSFSI